MPALCNRRGVIRWKAVVKMDGRQVASKWFGAGRKGGAEYKKAILWEQEERKRLSQQIDTIPTASLTLHEWATAYLTEVQERRAKSTYEEVRTAFRQIVQHLGPDYALSNLDPAAALTHLSRQKRERSANASNKDRKNLARGWKWASTCLRGFPREAPNPFLTMERYPEERLPRYVPPEEDFWKAYEHSEGQDRIILTAFLHLGARRGEIWRLKWADVDFHGNQIRLSTRKTRDGSWRYDWLPMSSELREALRAWRQERPLKDSEHVFVCLDKTPFCEEYYGQPFLKRNKYMPRLCKRAGVKEFGFHAIRHLAARILYRAGERLSRIQAFLRHKNPSTTERYLQRLGLDPDRLKDSVKVFELRRPGKLMALEKRKALVA